MTIPCHLSIEHDIQNSPSLIAGFHKPIATHFAPSV